MNESGAVTLPAPPNENGCGLGAGITVLISAEPASTMPALRAPKASWAPKVAASPAAAAASPGARAPAMCGAATASAMVSTALSGFLPPPPPPPPCGRATKAQTSPGRISVTAHAVRDNGAPLNRQRVGSANSSMPWA